MARPAYMQRWQEVAALFLYSLLWYLALPLVLLRLWRRGKSEPAYRQHWRERLAMFGHLAQPKSAPLIWLHAVSVGETRAAQPLIQALLAAYPNAQLLLTHMTPTGRATGAQLFASYGTRFQQAYLPYDILRMQRAFLRHYQPQICILMETEIWPNSIAACVAADVPIALVNARLSSRSLAKAEKMRWLMQPASRALDFVAAQTQADAQRIQSLGAARVEVTGSIKFDVHIAPEVLPIATGLRAYFQATHSQAAQHQTTRVRPILLCASTREGEEALLLPAFCAALGRSLPPDTLLLLVPRHPQRFAEVAELVQVHGLTVQRRTELSQAQPLLADTAVLLGDSMGEMFVYCALADLAFIGGSLLPLGGQNPIEACSMGKPVLFGPHTFNFEWVCEQAEQSGAGVRVADAAQMFAQAGQLFDSAELYAQKSAQALAFATQHKGATARTLALLAQYLQ